MEKCYICEKGNLQQKKVGYKLYGILLGVYAAEVCSICKETFYNETESRKMTESAKKKGLWGLKTRTRIGEAGSTLDIRLPKRIIDFIKVQKGREVEIEPLSKDKLIISF